MPRLNLKTARAWHLKLNFQELFRQSPGEAEGFLKRWYFWATHSRLEPMKGAAATIRRHWGGILRWFSSGLSIGLLEGMNSLIQAAKSRVRGYRTNTNLITMIYLLGAKLHFPLQSGEKLNAGEIWPNKIRLLSYTFWAKNAFFTGLLTHLKQRGTKKIASNKYNNLILRKSASCQSHYQVAEAIIFYCNKIDCKQ